VLLIQALEKLPEEELRSFDANLHEVLSDIKGNEYAKNAGASGNSDDAFLYLRNFVVGQGQAFYENVKNNPASMPKTLNTWFEYLDLIAPEVWAKKTGKKFDDWYQSDDNEQTDENKQNSLQEHRDYNDEEMPRLNFNKIKTWQNIIVIIVASIIATLSVPIVTIIYIIKLPVWAWRSIFRKKDH
jgi:hypothetical protein